MNLENYIKIIFPNQSFQLEKTEKGLTNDNYLLYLDHTTYMVRMQRDDYQHIIAQSGETQALKCIRNQGLDVNEYHYNPSLGIRITQYHPNALEYQEYHKKDKLMRVAQLMAKLHHLQSKIDLPFDPFSRLLFYKNQLQYPLYTLPNEDHWIEEAKLNYRPTVLCHNDWVSGNILFDGAQTYLIDYEYAADNDPLFDVMSFITENNIHDPQEKEAFYKYYFLNQPIPYQQLAIWEKFHHSLWCNWAMLMYENRHEEIYREIAKTKYLAYLK